MSLQTLRQQVWRFIPGLVLGMILIILWKALTVEDSPSANQESPFPAFSLGDVRTPDKMVSLNDVKGQVSIVHVWATWCGICVKEHDEWLRIKNKWPNEIVGIVYRDDADKVKSLLEKKGDPYQYLLNDSTGSLGLKLGLMGTPETYIVDSNGVIRFHYLGPVSLSQFEQHFLPVIEKIKNEKA